MQRPKPQMVAVIGGTIKLATACAMMPLADDTSQRILAQSQLMDIYVHQAEPPLATINGKPNDVTGFYARKGRRR